MRGSCGSKNKNWLVEVQGMPGVAERNGLQRSCVRSAMLYGSETRCLRENEMAISRRIERAMVRAMCGAKMMEKKRTEEWRFWD